MGLFMFYTFRSSSKLPLRTFSWAENLSESDRITFCIFESWEKVLYKPFPPTKINNKMMQFFTRTKSTINSIVLPDFGWTKQKDANDHIQWINPEQTMALHLNFFEEKPDLPSSRKIDTLRDFYRQQLIQVNGGLIEVDFSELENYRAIKTLFKIPQKPSGMVYLASLTLPFRECSYVIKIQAPEIGITGIRDSAIAARLMQEGKITSGENGYENWFSDPYDANFIKGTLMNKSEAFIYDTDFTNHPLTQARKLIAQIGKEIEFQPEMGKLKKFMK